MIVAGPAVYADGELVSPGWVRIEGDRIAEVGSGEPPAGDVERVAEGVIAPGFVDVHVHGGGGASFSTTEDADIDTVLAAHRAHGTTSMMASLVTASDDDLRAQVAALAPRVAAGDLVGIHLEGPWINPANKGAHDVALLRDPDLALLTELLDAAPGAIRMVTLAPELAHGPEMIRLLAERGVVAAIGHTSCTYGQAREAIEAGASGATHLFNAMPPLHHRKPGPILALVDDDRVHVEIIFDGVHVHPDLAARVVREVGDRAVLITDAMAAAGQPDGAYLLGKLPVTVSGGIARLTGSDTIAGSTLTLDAAVRHAVAAGIPLPDALAAATRQPAEYQGLTDVGDLVPGRRADLVVLDAELNVERVMVRGAWRVGR